MLIESKINIGQDSMFDIYQANFNSAHVLDKMAVVQSQRNRCVHSREMSSIGLSFEFT